MGARRGRQRTAIRGHESLVWWSSDSVYLLQGPVTSSLLGVVVVYIKTKVLRPRAWCSMYPRGGRVGSAALATHHRTSGSAGTAPRQRCRRSAAGWLLRPEAAEPHFSQPPPTDLRRRRPLLRHVPSGAAPPLAVRRRRRPLSRRRGDRRASVWRSEVRAEVSGAMSQDCSKVSDTRGLHKEPASASYNPNGTFQAWAASFTIW